MLSRDNNTDSERKQEQKLQRKLQEEIERKLKFRHTSVEDMNIDSQIVDCKEVQSLSTPPLTAADSMIH